MGRVRPGAQQAGRQGTGQWVTCKPFAFTFCRSLLGPAAIEASCVHCRPADPGGVWLGPRGVPLCPAAVGRAMELQLVQVPADCAVHSRDPFLWPE